MATVSADASKSLLSVKEKVNIDEPRWDQSTFGGRARHFFVTANPLNVLSSSQTLERAKQVVTDYRRGQVADDMTLDELWRAKQTYDSAFHPETGEKMILIGRMSAQVPMNTLITGCMMTFYRTTPAIVTWQLINQSFNACVNYTNRSGDTPIPKSQLAASFALATTAATGTALGLNAVSKRGPPLLGRLVPFAAVASANCINIPFMRQREIREGIPVFDSNGNRLGESSAAAKNAISKVIASRIGMAMPGMVIPPLVMNYLEMKTTVFKRMPWSPLPIQLGLCALILTFATPLCCALFPQKSSLPVNQLESSLQDKIRAGSSSVDRVYFNKGL